MMIALGMAFRNEPMEKVHVFVEDGDSAETLQKSLEESGPLRRYARLCGGGSSAASSRQERIDYLSDRNRTGSSWSFSFDPTRPGSVHARDSANDVLQRAAGRADVVATKDQSITEPGSRYIDFLVPGLIGMGLMGGGVWGVGFAIVDMRIRQVLKRFLATPMKKPHFVAAMMASRMVFMIPEIIVVLIVARFFFGVVNHGSYFSVAVDPAGCV